MAASTENDYPWQEPAKPIPRGAFIVVEGLDRAGKTTQVKQLCDNLYASGRNVKTMRFPGEPVPHLFYWPVLIGIVLRRAIQIEPLP